MKKITAMLMLLVFSIGITCADGFSPTKENTMGKYFRLCTPNRGNRYLTNNGAGNTMTGRVVAKFDNQVWRLLGRDDGTFDIQSVYDGSYMAMTSPITTSATKPADGWTFGASDTDGLFVVKSGTNQLNQQNVSNFNILNWGNGTNTTDDGCKYRIDEVAYSDFAHFPVKNGYSYTIAGYVARNGGTTNYVYYDGTTRTMSQTEPTDETGIWKAVFAAGGLKFESVHTPGKYLTYGGADDTGALYDITDGVAPGCVSMKIGGAWSASSETGIMGGAYKSSNGTVQNNNDWSTDWKVTELPVGLALSTTPTELRKNTSAGWVTGLAGTTNNQWSLPVETAVATDLGAAYTPSTGFYWGMCNGQAPVQNTDVNGLTASSFNLVGRQAYVGSFAAQVYATEHVIRDVNVIFTAGGTRTRTSFSIWKLVGTTATLLAQSTSSELAEGEQSFSANDIKLPAGGRLIFIWNANNAGNTLNITGFKASYVEGEESDITEDITYTVDKTAGSLYRDNVVSETAFCSIWKSTDTPQLTFGCSKNNMQWNGNNIDVYTGQALSCTYTVNPPAGYRIKAYSFSFANDGHDTGITLTHDGNTYTTSRTAQTVSKDNQKLGSVEFTLSGANSKAVLLTDFTVKVEPVVELRPEISTEGNEHWYYIVNAAAANVTYCSGKVIYADPTDSYKMKFGDRQYRAEYIWSFWEKDGKIAIKNYAGKYFGTAPAGTGGGTQFNAQDTENYIYTINDAYNYFTIKDNNVELHAQNSGSVIVRWEAGEGNASLWRFEEADVTSPEVRITSTNVRQGRVTTGIGNRDLPILRSTLAVDGLTGTVAFKGVSGTITGTGAASVEKVKVYFATNARELVTEPIQGANGVTWREANAELFGEAEVNGTSFTITRDEARQLSPGNHYMWIAYDISAEAQEGTTVDATITSYNVDGNTIAENNGNPAYQATIFLSEGTVLMPKDKGVDKVNGSTYYRIPAITMVQKNGKPRLVTLTDDRLEHNTDLPSHCYLVAQYSDDLGKTWSEPKVVAGTAETGGDYGHGDASLVTNRDNGEIIGIMTTSANGNGFFYSTPEKPQTWKTVKSSDGGETWGVPVDHTKELYAIGSPNPTWKGGFSGSGAALQLRDGTLVSSFVNRESDNSQHFYLFMSDDGGDSWHVQGTSGTTNADEPKTLERNNGDLAISVRASGRNYYNVTSDRGATWHYAPETRFEDNINGNACDGEYMVWCSSNEGNLVAEDIGDIAFQTCPNNASRQNLSIALSTDEGEHFGTPKTICPSGSAYSAATVLPDGTLGVYYEENGIFGGYTMRFVRFSLDWASDGKYKFTTAHPYRPIASTKPAEFKHEEAVVSVSGQADASQIATYVENISDDSNVSVVDVTNANVTSTFQELRDELLANANVSQNVLNYAKPGAETTETPNVVIGDECRNLVVTDGAPMPVTAAFTAVKAAYVRPMDTQWGTLCLPYDIIADHENAPYDLYTISANTGEELVLSIVDDGVVSAGTPVIVYRNAKESGIDMTNDNGNIRVSGSREGSMQLVGCLEQTQITEGYYIADNAFWNASNVTGGVVVPPFRAYIANSGNARRLAISIDTDTDATGIEAIDAMNAEGATYYDMSGRKTNGIQPGINVVRTVDGKSYKVIIK